MDKKEVIFLAASVLMVKSESHKNIVNKSGRDAFERDFTIYQHLLEDLYEAPPDKSLKK